MSLAFDSQVRIPWATESGALTSVRPNSTNATATIPDLAAYPGTIREAQPSNAVFQQQEAVFTFSTGSVTFDPKPRDTLLWDSQTWVVKAATRSIFLRFWRLDCFRLVAQADLADSITHWRPSPTATSDGLRSVTLSQIGGAYLGRLQPDGNTVQPEVDGKMVRRRRWKAYLPTAVTLLAGDQLSVGGAYYEVVGQSQIDQYDTFTIATCEELD